MNKDKAQIVIYMEPSGEVRLETHFHDESIWLSQQQIADLFGVNRPAITKHINNILSTGELDKSVCSILEHTAKDGKKYETQFYNLDMIISVGYRVNSKKATQFRVWANQILRDYLVKGYVINQDRLKQERKLFEEIKNTILLIGKKASFKELAGREKDLLDLIADYIKSWQIFEQYDQNTLEVKNVHRQTEYHINHYLARTVIDEMRYKLIETGIASDLFGRERDSSFESILASLEQTFDGQELYGSVEEKAAHLLYFVIKDHPFVDGNKRIASILFLNYLEKNGLLCQKDGKLKFNDRSVVALALLVAVSDPKEKDNIVKLVVNLIQD